MLVVVGLYSRTRGSRSVLVGGQLNGFRHRLPSFIIVPSVRDWELICLRGHGGSRAVTLHSLLPRYAKRLTMPRMLVEIPGIPQDKPLPAGFVRHQKDAPTGAESF